MTSCDHAKATASRRSVLIALVPLTIWLSSLVATALFASDTTTIQERANQLLQTGDYVGALEVLKTGLEQQAGDATLLAMVEVIQLQREDERHRLIELALSTFFEEPSRSCRAWRRLLQIDPEDRDAAGYLQHLSETVETSIDVLVTHVQALIDAGQFVDAENVANRVKSMQCMYERSDSLFDRISQSRREVVDARLKEYATPPEASECPRALAPLRELVADPGLTRKQTASAYLSLAVCEARTQNLEAARSSFRRALDFDPDASITGPVEPEVLAIFDEAR